MFMVKFTVMLMVMPILMVLIEIFDKEISQY